MRKLNRLLGDAAKRKRLPTVIAYNRIDGPGSSLDLPVFQQSFWSLPDIPDNLHSDPAMAWTRMLPRTIGITINMGTKIYAEEFDSKSIAVQSVEYGTESVGTPGHILPIKSNWLLKIIELFGLQGVKFVLHNLRPGIQSSGLGGSASATTGVCILANELAGRPFGPSQLIMMASRIEQDFGISLTGTQEQSNVIYGGVCDYIWFPWGIPANVDTKHDTSIRTELMPSLKYIELEERMAIFHTGIIRTSTDVNSIWVKALSNAEGYQLHRRKLGVAYQFREGLRLGNWEAVADSIREYQELRTGLCHSYMDGAKEIQGFAQENNCAVFPLGAGGGGGIFVFGPDPISLKTLKMELKDSYREIPFKILPHGHDIINLPL